MFTTQNMIFFFSFRVIKKKLFYDLDFIVLYLIIYIVLYLFKI
jgi:hypothetical protein